jgi:DNA-binding GntR family transcriptional regulator
MPASEKDTTREDERLAPINVRNRRIPGVPKQILADALKDRIVRGVYPVGPDFPSLTDLEKMTGVARGTIRAALKILAEQGYVKSVIGIGTWVLPNEYWGKPELLKEEEGQG